MLHETQKYTYISEKEPHVVKENPEEEGSIPCLFLDRIMNKSDRDCIWNSKKKNEISSFGKMSARMRPLSGS